MTTKEIKDSIALLAESQLEMKDFFKETREMFKETKALSKQIDKNGKQIRENGKHLKAAQDLFTSQWGKLMESLVEGEAIKLFNTKGIEVQYISTRVSGNTAGQNFEFDIIAHNGIEIVIIEVKTTLRVKAVKHFTQKLQKVKKYIQAYKNNKIHGAIAYLRAEEDSHTFAENNGLWVIRATGNSASITNKATFKPQIF